MPPTMAFRTEPKSFASAVTWVAKHLPNRPPNPVLAGLLLEVAEGQVTVAAFDHDIAVRARVDVVGDATGRVVVSGRLLAALVATFPDRPIDVTFTGAALEIVCGRIRVTLPTLPEDEYPTLPVQPPAVGTVSAPAFAEMVERVAVAADREAEAALAWQYAIRLALGRDEIELMATNRYRAAMGRVPWHADLAECVAIVPMPMLVDAAKVFTAATTVTIGIDPGGLVGFATDTRSVAMRPIAVDYPVQLRDLFPSRDDAAPTVPVAELAAALKRSNLVRAALGPALLTFTEDGLVIDTHGENNGKATELVDCTHSGENLTVAMNPQYLAEALGALPGEVAEFSITAPLKPVLLTTPEDKGATYTHLIVPIRVS